jgi:hypothetical protein
VNVKESKVHPGPVAGVENPCPNSIPIASVPLNEALAVLRFDTTVAPFASGQASSGRTMQRRCRMDRIFIGVSVVWFIGVLVAWFIGVSVVWFIGVSVVWFIGVLVAWFIGVSVVWFIGVSVAWFNV